MKEFSEAAQADMIAVHDRITAIAIEYDTRIVAAILANRTACAYAALIRAGIEKPERVRTMLTDLLAYTMELSEKGPMPKTVMISEPNRSEQ